MIDGIFISRRTEIYTKQRFAPDCIHMAIYTSEENKLF